MTTTSGGALPLEGLRVLDLSRNTAGPYAAMILGDMGADVLKIERPGTGDDARAWGPPFWDGQSCIFLSQNRNKRSMTLDLKKPRARAVMDRLATSSDIIVESFRPGALQAMGYGPDWAMGVNERLIYCSISGYGPRGPRAREPGYDSLTQAMGGLMSVTGEPGRPPIRVGTSIIDMATGMWLCLAALGALRTRDRTSKGTHITVSLFETALAWMSLHATGYWATGKVPSKHGSAMSMIVPYQALEAADGHIVIAAPNDELYRRLCGVLGRDDLGEDERYRTNPDRVEHAGSLLPELESETGKWTVADLVDRLLAVGVPAAPVQDIAQVCSDPQSLALGIFQSGEHPRIEDFKTVAVPFEVGEQRPGLRRPPPLLGEHTLDVLTELGFAPGDVEGLASDGVVVCEDGPGERSPG